jgi:hypothetical protein
MGGEVYLRPLLNERAGFQDASDLSGHVKHTVWSHVEVTGTRAGVGTHQLPTLLDVQADRGIVRMVHATICREKETPRVVSKRPRQRGQVSVRVPVRFFPEEPDGLSSQVGLAHCIFAVLIRDTLARFGCRTNGSRRNEEDDEDQAKL